MIVKNAMIHIRVNLPKKKKKKAILTSVFHFAANPHRFFPIRFLADRPERVRSDLDAGRKQRFQAPVVLFRGVEHGGEPAVHVQHRQLREGELAVQLWYETDSVQRDGGSFGQAGLGENGRRHLLLSKLLSTADQREELSDHFVHCHVSSRVRRLLPGVSLPLHVQPVDDEHLEVDQEGPFGHIFQSGDTLRNAEWE